MSGGGGFTISGSVGTIKVRGVSGTILGGGAERAVTARLLNHLGVEIPGALDNSFGRNFTHIGSDFGRGTVSLGREDANADELVRGRLVQILVGGIVRFTFKIQGDPRLTEVSVGEELREAITVSGLGWGCTFHEAVLHPESGVDSPLDYGFRMWSAFSVNFPNLDGWGPAVERYEYHDGIAYGARIEGIVDPGPDPDDPADDVLKLYPSPKDFPWPNAEKNGNGFEPTPAYVPTYWVTAFGAPSEESIGYHLFRGGFGLGGEQAVTLHGTGDNLFVMFLDGVPIIEEVNDTLCWLGWKDVTRVLPAGFRHVGFVVENIDADIDYNPGGAIFDAIAISVYPGDVETSLTIGLLNSSTADLPYSIFVAAGDEWPGWYAGQIIPDFTDEAQAQGALVLYEGGTFTTTHDTEGNEFPPIPIFAMQAGQTDGEALLALVDQGHIDFDFHAGGAGDWLLDVWVKGQAGTVTTVDFHEPTDPDDPTSGNLQELQRGEVRQYANYLLVQWAGGFTVVEDTAEQTAYGSVVMGFLRTDASTRAEAQTMGLDDLAERKLSATAGVSIQILPTSSADTPYEGFGMFDYVAIPQADGTGTDSVQVLTIDLSEDGEGWAIWRLDVNKRMRAPAREVLDLLQALGGIGFSGSGSARE